MIIFGSRNSKISSFEIINCYCEYCGNNTTHNIIVFGNYFHIFWIPILPLGTKVFSECTHCKRTLKKKYFTPKIKEAYIKNKPVIKRPFWHFTGLILIGLFIMITLVTKN